MSPIDHLRLETKCLPIRENCKMIATQFAIAARNNHHPCHKTIHREPADRYIKKTLLEHLKEEEVRITIPEDSNNKTVHSLYVHRVIDRMESNKVLNDFPPVNPDKLFKLEKNLTREQEVRICQLRSGYSPKLNGYLHRIGGATDPECRKCRRERNGATHDELLPEQTTRGPLEFTWGNCQTHRRPSTDERPITTTISVRRAIHISS